MKPSLNCLTFPREGSEKPSKRSLCDTTREWRSHSHYQILLCSRAFVFVSWNLFWVINCNEAWYKLTNESQWNRHKYSMGLKQTFSVVIELTISELMRRRAVGSKDVHEYSGKTLPRSDFLLDMTRIMRKHRFSFETQKSTLVLEKKEKILN